MLTETKLWKLTTQVVNSKHLLVSWIFPEMKCPNEETDLPVMRPFYAFIAKDAQ
jgi:hypothetical protein